MSSKQIRAFVVEIGLATLVAVLMAHAVTQMVFSTLGEPLGGRHRAYILALVVALGLAGIGSGLQPLGAPKLSRLAFTVSGVASSALLGFFYGGILTDKNPQIAMITAVVLSLVMTGISLRRQARAIALSVSVAGAIASYGLAFWLWAVALALLSGQKWMPGVLLIVLSLIYLGFTLRSILLAWHRVNHLN